MTSSCQHPGCGELAEETYVDAHGNELELCEEDYFEAVHPAPGPVPAIRSTIEGDDRPGGLWAMFK